MRLGGIAKVTINGITIRCDDSGVKVNKGKPERESIRSLEGAGDYTETPGEPTIEFEALDDPKVDWDMLEDGDNLKIQIDKPNGKTFIGIGMWYAGDYSVSTKDGKRSMKFIGRKIVES